jgi:peptidoglycan/LPS O-acetylase OafA/YrhL
MLKSWPARLLLPAVFLLVFAYVSRVTAHPSRYWVGGVALMATAIVWVASYNGDYVLPRGRLKRAACWMGARSYGIYLIHVPAYYAAREIWFRLAPAVVGPGLHHMAILNAWRSGSRTACRKPSSRQAEHCDAAQRPSAQGLSAAI